MMAFFLKKGSRSKRKRRREAARNGHKMDVESSQDVIPRPLSYNSIIFRYKENCDSIKILGSKGDCGFR